MAANLDGITILCDPTFDSKLWRVQIIDAARRGVSAVEGDESLFSRQKARHDPAGNQLEAAVCAESENSRGCDVVDTLDCLQKSRQ